MWMVDCDDHEHVKDLKVSIGRKLRPLIPRPITAATATTTAMNCVFSALPSSCCCTNNPNIIAWSQPISCELSDYGIKREMNRVPLVSPRWNPTPEQLQALEELYRRGIRTPSAQQIQHIAAKLRRFGKIEGKNVFYWFQNHKARERQKKRRQLELHAGKMSHHADAIQAQQTDISEDNDRHYLYIGHGLHIARYHFPNSPPRRSGIEFVSEIACCSRENTELHHVKKQSSTFSNSSTPSQDSVSLHAAVVATEWTKLDQRGLQQQAKNEQTCWQLDLSSCIPSNNSTDNVINKNVVISEVPPKDDEIRNQTLLLFPIKSHGSSTPRTIEEEIKHEEEIYNDGLSIGMASAPNEFYEFFPTKN